jgi:hypothetical protein
VGFGDAEKKVMVLEKSIDMKTLLGRMQRSS